MLTLDQALSICPKHMHIKQAGMEAIMNLACKYRSHIALQSELMGAGALGINAVLCNTGDHPLLGDHKHAKPVYDLDSLGLVRLAKRLRDEGEFDNGRAVDADGKPSFLIGTAGSHSQNVL